MNLLSSYGVKTKIRWEIIIVVIIAVVGLFLLASSRAEAQTATNIEVTANDPDVQGYPLGWGVHNPDDGLAWIYQRTGVRTNNAVARTVYGPETPPNGSEGSMALESGDVGTTAMMMYTGYNRALLSDITSYSFDTYINQRISNSGVQALFYIDLNNDGLWDDSLTFDNGTLASDNTWENWDLMAVDWVVGSTGAAMTLGEYAAANPTARINSPGSTWTGFIIATGHRTNGIYLNFHGYVDNVEVNGVGYDFEPSDPWGSISSPAVGDVNTNFVSIEAQYSNYFVGDIPVDWYVSPDSCDVNTAIAGNVHGMTDAYTWDNQNLAATVSTNGWAPGSYCLTFNPNGQDDGVEETVTFEVDNFVSKVEGIHFAQDGEVVGCNVFTNSRYGTLKWDAVPDTDLYRYELQYHIGDINDPPFFTITFPENYRDFALRNDDPTYYMHIRAIDNLGNVGEWSDWCVITFDHRAPVNSLTSPAEGELVSGIVSFEGTVSDNRFLESYSITATNTAGEIFDICSVSTSETLVDGVLCDWDTSDLAAGYYDVTLSSEDGFGNVSLDAELRVEVEEVIDYPTNIWGCFNGGWELGAGPDQPFNSVWHCVIYFWWNS